MIGAVAIVLLAASGSVGTERSAFQSATADADPVVGVIISRASQEALEEYRRQSRADGPTEAVASHDAVTGLIRIDLRGGRLPETGGAALEDLQGFISNGALEAMRSIDPATGTRFFYNGRAFEDQYPGEAVEATEVLH